ncbi:VanZ family protein [Streptomyces sp. NPDC053755]|uniref:VanZ family protein n=1 Tax=Streptomyces sp. NPDC053755 TaxID=3155815 RepID=UPI0034336B6C
MQRQGSSGSAAVVVRRAGFALLLTHLLLVAWVSLRPLDVAWVTAPNLTPLAGLEADLALGPAEAARRIGEGLLLLAPLGVLLPMADGRLYVSPWASLARTVAAGVLVSLAVELLQTAVPGQVVDVDSVLLNGVGVALAHLLVVPAGRARLRRREDAGRGRSSSGRTARRGPSLPRDEGGQGTTPTIPRVGIAP